MNTTGWMGMEMKIQEFTRMIFERLDPEKKNRFTELKNNKTGFWAEMLPDMELERRHAARIIHELLLFVLLEKDEENLTPAFELPDIYECRICTFHIAQVYVKGIMSTEDGLFGVRYPVMREEAVIILKRVFDSSLRSRPEDTVSEGYEEEAAGKIQFITMEGLKDKISIGEKYLAVDIRSKYEADDPVKDTENIFLKLKKIPVTELIKNPYILNQYITGLSVPIILIGNYDSCDMGAECLTEAGFKRIYILVKC